MDARKITKKSIEEFLRLGREATPVITEATGMVNGGEHRWWIDEDDNVCIYGEGPGWHDQGFSTTYTVEDAVSYLWRNHRAEIAKAISESFYFCDAYEEIMKRNYDEKKR